MATPFAPSVVFGPDVRHGVESPPTLTVVLADPTTHVSVRKDRDVVLAEARETVVVSAREHWVFAPKTTHSVVFRPPR